MRSLLCRRGACVLMLLGWLGGSSWAAGTTGRAFACTDYTQGKVFVIAADGTLQWEFKTTKCNDLWVLPNGNVLFNTGRGVQEVTRTGQVVFDYQSKSEIYACQRLANGNTFVGECNSGRLLEITPGGTIAKEVRLLPEGSDGGHLYMRNARRLPNGHYLVAHYGQQIVREYDATGGTVLTIPAVGGPHSVARLPNGHTVITCGDLPGGARIFEVDRSGETVWQVQGDDLPGISLKFIAGFQRLLNGNTVIANWLGRGQFGKAPHIIEITRDKRVVWAFADHTRLRTVSSVQVLDDQDATRPDKIWHRFGTKLPRAIARLSPRFAGLRSTHVLLIALVVAARPEAEAAAATDAVVTATRNGERATEALIDSNRIVDAWLDRRDR